MNVYEITVERTTPKTLNALLLRAKSVEEAEIAATRLIVEGKAQYLNDWGTSEEGEEVVCVIKPSMLTQAEIDSANANTTALVLLTAVNEPEACKLCEGTGCGECKDYEDDDTNAETN